MDSRENTKKKSKRITKALLIKGTKGAISIFLCLLLTPFLTIALGLAEYARYQEVYEITEELYELTGVSVLSDYDTYLHNRFGVLATSQKNDLAQYAPSLLIDNAKVLGNQVTIGNPKVSGSLALSDTQILRQQIIDVSELTATTAILAVDFKLEELLNKLQGVSQFQDIMNTVDSLADMADALSTALDKLEELEAAVETLKSDISSAKSYAETLSTKMSDLFKKLGDNGVVLPANATTEEIETAISSFTGTYLQDLKDAYRTGHSLISKLNDIKSDIGTVKTSAEAFASAVSAASQAAQNITKENSADEDGSIANKAASTLEEVLDSMEELVEDTVADITDDVVNAVKSTANQIVNTALESTGLAGITTRYYEIVNGDYFSLPLSDTAKGDLVDLLQTVKTVYDSKSASGLLDYFKSKFVPNFNFDAGQLLTDIKAVVSEATEALTDGVGDKLISLLTKLVNIVKGLFDLDLFYEPDMNAYVNIGNASASPYQSFMDAIGDLFSAIDTFKNAMKENGLFSKIKGALKAMKEMFAAIGDLMGAIIDIAGAAVTSIVELGSSLFSGDVRGLYEKLLISGYMRHNLPCRVNSGDWTYDEDGNSVNLSVDGVGLTGFAYSDIPRPPLMSAQNPASTGFLGLAQTLQNLKNGYGQDEMFRGAELEYIRAGTNSEIANQVICFFDIYFLRLLLDLPSVFMDAEVAEVAAAATVAAWVVYILYIIVEPFCDTLLLVNGESVPLIRTDCWLTATGVMTFVNKIGSAVLGPELQTELNNYTSSHASSSKPATGGSGTGEMNYQTHMLILLLIFVDSNTQISRLQNLMELEAKAYYEGSFTMNKAYTAVNITAETSFNPFFDLGTASGGSVFTPRVQLKRTVSY